MKVGTENTSRYCKVWNKFKCNQKQTKRARMHKKLTWKPAAEKKARPPRGKLRRFKPTLGNYKQRER
jgi:hypothetical protein